MEYNDPKLSEARALHSRVGGLVDLHVDCIIQNRLFGYNLRKRHRRGVRGQPLFWHADLPRMREGGYGVALMGIHYWPWESARGWRECNTQIDVLDRVAQEDPGAMRVRQPGDLEAAAEQGLLALMPGVEGAHMLHGQLDHVRALARRQVAYLTLTHFSRNSAATPSMGRGSNERDGLSDFGRQVVQELNRWGVAVDCAHLNTPGVLEVCQITRAPVFCTHTGVKAVREHPRNITDAEIDAIAAVDGVIGVMASTNFLTRGFWGTSEAMVRHLDHIVQRVGPRHAALGSDFDGWIPIMRDQRDCLDLVKVTWGLMQRGYREEDLALILRDNSLRVLRRVHELREGEP